MILFSAWLWLSGVAFAQSGNEYRIGAGDTIDIQIHGVEVDTTDLRVAETGKVNLPYVGLVKVAGLTSLECAEHLRTVLGDGYFVNPEVTVKVKDYTSQQVEVFGALGSAGVYNLSGSTTIRSLVAQAGGIDFERSAGYLEVTRGSEKTRIRVSDLEGVGGNFLLQAGDVIDANIGNTIFLAGQVANPGPISYNNGLTASQALLMAGGRAEYGRLSGAYIVRGTERIQINLKRVLKGKDADVQLKPGDRMVIPQSPI